MSTKMTEKDNESDYSAQARRLRTQLKLSQEEMAYRMGFTRQYYNELENDKREWSKRAKISLNVVKSELSESVRTLSHYQQTIFPQGRVADEKLNRYNVKHSRQKPDITEIMVMLNPDFEFSDTIHEESEERIEAVIRYLQPWFAAGLNDPEIASYILGQLKIHLPINHINNLENSQNL